MHQLFMPCGGECRQVRIRGPASGPQGVTEVILCMVLMALMIGLRFEVAADWDAYVEIFRRFRCLTWVAPCRSATAPTRR